jgi:hypothetical protein
LDRLGHGLGRGKVGEGLCTSPDVAEVHRVRTTRLGGIAWVHADRGAIGTWGAKGKSAPLSRLPPRESMAAPVSVPSASLAAALSGLVRRAARAECATHTSCSACTYRIGLE